MRKNKNYSKIIFEWENIFCIGYRNISFFSFTIEDILISAQYLFTL